MTRGSEVSVPQAPEASGVYDGLLRIINKTRNTEVGARIEVAKSGGKRSKGLLGRKSLEWGSGMWIVPCEAIHMFFMKFAIDVLYLDKKLHVKKVVPNLRPWRMSACLSAHSVLELPVGAIQASQCRPGDVLEFITGGEQQSMTGETPEPSADEAALG